MSGTVSTTLPAVVAPLPPAAAAAGGPVLGTRFIPGGSYTGPFRNMPTVILNLLLDYHDFDSLGRWDGVCRASHAAVAGFSILKPLLISSDPSRPIPTDLTNPAAFGPHLSSPLLAERALWRRSLSDFRSVNANPRDERLLGEWIRTRRLPPVADLQKFYAMLSNRNPYMMLAALSSRFIDTPIARNPIWGGKHPHITSLCILVNEAMAKAKTMQSTFEKCPSLRQVSIRPPATSCATDFYHGCELPPGIESLSCDDNMYDMPGDRSFLTDETLAALTKTLSRLRFLKLAYSPSITTTCVIAILHRNPTLQELDIHNCRQITVKEIRDAAAKSNPLLTPQQIKVRHMQRA